MRLRHFGIALVVFALFIVATPAYADLTTPITGTVKDPLGVPIVGATVSDGLRSATTDVNGHYSVDETPTSGFTLTASKTGYDSLSQSGVAVPGTVLNFTLLFAISMQVSPTAFNNTPPKSLGISVGSYAPSTSCFTWTDATSSTPVVLTLTNLVPGGQSTWTGSYTVPSGRADGTFSHSAIGRQCASQVALTRTASGTTVVDSVVPILGSWTPAPLINILVKRPFLSVTLSDERSGIDSTSLIVKLDGTTITSYGYNAITGLLSYTPGTDLAMDSDHIFEVAVSDRAGNATIGATQFRLIKILQSDLTVSIPDVQATVPANCSGCIITFSGVQLNKGPHTTTISSTFHPGRGSFTRVANLGGAQVTWAVGPPTSAGLTSATISEPTQADDALFTPLHDPFIDEMQALSNVSVTVPANVPGGSIAHLQMAGVVVPPGCVDTSATSCNLATAGTPLPDPLNGLIIWGPPDQDPTIPEAPLPDTVPTIPGEPAPDDDPLVRVTTPFPCGDVSALSYRAGKIAIKIKADSDSIGTIVQRQGDSIGNVVPVDTGPFDDVDLEVGINRHYYITVPVGLEQAKVVAYQADPGVECTHLISEIVTRHMAQSDTLSSGQWNLFGERGLQIRYAWDYGNYNDTGSRPIDGWTANDWSIGRKEVEVAILDDGVDGTHEDFRTPSLVNKIKAGWSMSANSAGSSIPAGANSTVYYCEAGENLAHGNAVASTNAATDNGKGFAGVNWNGRIIPIYVFQYAPNCTQWYSGGNSNSTSVGSRGAPIKKAVSLGAEVINMSYGFTTDQPDAKECDEIKAAYLRGVLSVVSAPEDNYPDAKNEWPESCALAFPVTNSNQSGGRGTGVTPTNVDSHVLVAAPGTDIPVFDDVGGYKSGNKAKGINGTSFSAPQVAGIAQLLTAMGTPVQVVYNTIWHSSTPVSWCAAPCGGKVNAYRAISSTMKNGSFETWPAADQTQYPFLWSLSVPGGSCATTKVIGRIDDISTHHDHTPGGSRNLYTKCVGGGNIDFYQTVRVSNGWKYRFSTWVAVESNGPAPSNIYGMVCWLRSNNTRLGPCSVIQPQQSSTSWQQLSMLVQVPGGAAKAQVILRSTGSSATGGLNWDDAGFYAYQMG